MDLKILLRDGVVLCKLVIVHNVHKFISLLRMFYKLIQFMAFHVLLII